MSLNKFSKLFEELDSNNSINKKINTLTKYFKSSSNLNNILTIQAFYKYLHNTL